VSSAAMAPNGSSSGNRACRRALHHLHAGGQAIGIARITQCSIPSPSRTSRISHRRSSVAVPAIAAGRCTPLSVPTTKSSWSCLASGVPTNGSRAWARLYRMQEGRSEAAFLFLHLAFFT
jgi:hypothetical protein